MRNLLILGAAVVLAACAGPGPRVPAPPAEAVQCVALFADVDAAVEHAGVRDAMSTRIAGFPHLRVNRLLASFRDVDDDAGIRFWLDQLARLDAEARAIELANLPHAVHAALEGAHASPGRPLATALGHCRETLLAADRLDPARLTALRDAAVVPDDYSLARRIVGLYPLTRLPFAAGVRAFERELKAVFALAPAELPVRGTLQRFGPAPGATSEPMSGHLSQKEPEEVSGQRFAKDAGTMRAAEPVFAAVPAPEPHSERADSARLIEAASANPLRLPLPDEQSLRALAVAHAPVYEIDVFDGHDRIGRPVWPPQGPARIDAGEPIVFYRAAHARVGDRVLLQLVYTAWFPARPPSAPFDLLAGHLDALVWRVTLDLDGEPLVFDSMHGCGCYHLFIPTSRVRIRAAKRPALEEWLFAPQALPRQQPNEQVVLRVASRTHYLQRVLFEPRPAHAAIPYALEPEDTLRSLPHPDGGRRSLYGPRGFVAGTERAERFFFWPMGIVNPGAMRQWGRHATAFVGRRHFDDPWLIEDRFERLD